MPPREERLLLALVLSLLHPGAALGAFFERLLRPLGLALGPCTLAAAARQIGRAHV